jgi:hypothetical protein
MHAVQERRRGLRLLEACKPRVGAARTGEANEKKAATVNCLGFLHALTPAPMARMRRSPIHLVVAAQGQEGDVVTRLVQVDHEADTVGDAHSPQAVEVASESVEPEARMVRIFGQPLQRRREWRVELAVAAEELSASPGEGGRPEQLPHLSMQLRQQLGHRAALHSAFSHIGQGGSNPAALRIAHQLGEILLAENYYRGLVPLDDVHRPALELLLDRCKAAPLQLTCRQGIRNRTHYRTASGTSIGPRRVRRKPGVAATE